MSEANVQDTRLSLDVNLTHAAAQPLYDALAASRGRSISLCAQNVSHLGAQCLQILIAASRMWSADGYDLKIVNVSNGFDEGLRRFGLDDTALPLGE